RKTDARGRRFRRGAGGRAASAVLHRRGGRAAAAPLLRTTPMAGPDSRRYVPMEEYGALSARALAARPAGRTPKRRPWRYRERSRVRRSGGSVGQQGSEAGGRSPQRGVRRKYSGSRIYYIP